jgi:hypothetical protein
VAGLRPPSPADWLIVAGDVGEFAADIEWALGTLRERFAEVIWVPGNHELWTHRREPLRLRGVERYEHLVALCRRLGVHTPEDPYPVWKHAAGPLVIAPLFLLYDYSFLPTGATTKAEALERAYAAGIIGNDESMLHADPYPSKQAWCGARLASTERRLAALPAGTRTILVNHFPLVREPTRVLRYPAFASGAAPHERPTGRSALTPPPLFTVICTSRGRPGMTASATSRCRSDIRENGAAAPGRP